MPPHPPPVPDPPVASFSTERLDMMRLARTSGVGPVNFSRLMTQYRSAEAALEALPERMRLAGRPEMPSIPSRTQIADEADRLERTGARIVLRSDPAYPAWLSYLPDAPPVLFVQGNIRNLSQRSIGVVGARNASAAGIRMAGALATELATAGIQVISGLARGIDSAAHEGALHKGMTVAAIAGGLDHVYPPENARLQAEIAEKGCLVTEAPPGTVPQARHFPRRNRLIAGLSEGCVVVEAALRSGTLITARLAADYGRTLFAVPGSPLDPRSRGGNDLLRNGAVLTENVHDIVRMLGNHPPPFNPAPWQNACAENGDIPGFQEPQASWRGSASPSVQPHRPVIEKLLTLLSVTPVTVDDVLQHCQFSVSVVLAALTELELGGAAEFLPGGRVALLPNYKETQGPEWQ